MPSACHRLIAKASSKLGLGRRACDGAGPVGLRRRPYLPSCCNRHSHHVATSDVDVSEHAATREGPKILTDEGHHVSPLVHFESAVIRYPPSASDFEYGLDADCNGIDGDLILESQSSLELDQREKQQHLQQHWDKQQSTPVHSISHESSHVLCPIDELSIWPNLECGSGGGGHVVLGRNGAGKTLLSRSLVHSLTSAASDDCDPTTNTALNENNPFFHAGSLSMNRRHISKNRNHHFLSHVSFDSHSDLLLDTNTTTVHRALIPSGGNRLSPTAKFLAVRLGMYPLLPRHVNTLSTGEIRRVLLVRALVSKPELLILDNAFDGLDVNGRNGLQDIIERVLKGFRMDILVQGVGDAKDTARTQVLLLTHRPDEIADGMGRVTFIDKGNGAGARVQTEDRLGRNALALVRSLESLDDRAEVSSCEDSERDPMHPWDIVSDSDFPSNAEISNYWHHGKSNTRNEEVLVHATDLKVTRDDTTLLSHLDWRVLRGERWHLAGTNGAGKSTLSRLLLRMSMNGNQEWNAGNNRDAVIADGALDVVRGGIGWVSTELHLHAAQNWSNRTVGEILTLGAASLFNADKRCDNHSLVADPDTVDVEIAMTAACWLGLLDTIQCRSGTGHSFLSRRFSSLSQGEQKLLLVASAIAHRPSLLVLDEPCQGLDLWFRGHLLGLVERICRGTDMSLIYITHHEEELIQSIGHRLCLEDGKASYCGPR